MQSFKLLHRHDLLFKNYSSSTFVSYHHIERTPRTHMIQQPYFTNKETEGRKCRPMSFQGHTPWKQSRRFASWQAISHASSLLLFCSSEELAGFLVMKMHFKAHKKLNNENNLQNCFYEKKSIMSPHLTHVLRPI